jgi:5-methylcytosine-specific restriction endonuclease McrA
VLERALDVLVTQLEKRKYGITEKPRQTSRESKSARHVPARVRRAVHERDQNRCTFVAPNGRRCEARGGLEFDHIEPVARGGQSTASNLRLRCRAHNQYTAEQAYGAEFMKTKIDQAREERARGSLHPPA